MQAIILAAGKGTRLGFSYPKCLTYVAGNMLLDKCVRELKENDIKDIIIVTGYKTEDIIFECLEYLPEISMSFVYNKRYDTTNNCISLLKGLQIVDDDVLIIESDIIYDKEIISILTSEKHKFCWAVDEFSEGMTGSALKVDRNNRITLVKYLTEFQPNRLKSVGMLYVPREYVKTLKMWLEDRWNDNLYYDDVIAQHLMELPIYTKNISGKLWYEIDTKEDLKKARELFNGL